MKTITLDPLTFEDVRKSVDRLPADGDSFTLDAADIAECKLCAFSHEAALFAKRVSRRQSVFVTKAQSVTKPDSYKGNTRRRVRCQSGTMGERSRLQSRYASYADFVSYDRTYGLAERLSPGAHFGLWERNPVIESSVNPADLRVVFP